MKSAPIFLLLLAGLPFSGHAQSRTTADSMRQRGELTGARPSGDLLAKPRTAPAASRTTTSSDPIQQHLLNSDVNLARVSGSELPDLYERFIATTRDERRKWSYQDWDNAATVLARLNQRYEKVRTELPIEERLRIRTYQGEFHTLRGARQVKDKIDE
ncbi:hypothetical protein Q3A66_18700 [Hymenobacter sp. BT770]|uniref:hypothetical protein n=1 Tax=Hymenobacter sp. BT770 TaxID=2886942 RepID=UPI001D118A28|nr:hypothetical protein [Hymenobacter sp. BT770]MCC3151993.1 hypothetical protein [Hymenobacter sp. BT770]MDO3417103.1 hypothetical protein [Hymenobacter sp. BT770]